MTQTTSDSTSNSSDSSDTIVQPESGIHLDKASREAAKRIVLFTVFLDILGFGIIIPQLGIYAAQFGATPMVVGFLASSYSAMQFLFAPFWGRLSDRIGRRPILVWSIFGTALGYVVFAFANSLPWLFAARILDGITGANISTAQAYLSDVTEPEERAKTFGIFGAIFGIGFAIGPLIGSLLSHLPGAWGANMGIGIFTAVLGLINWALALRRLPETLSPEVRAANAARHAQRGGMGWSLINIHGFQRALSLPGLNRIMIIGFVSMVAFATLQGTFTLYLIAKYVRPEVQTYIVKNPEASAVEAHRRLTEHKTHTTGAGEESVISTPSATDNEPYSAAMGGDFEPQGLPPAKDMSWRQVEKVLVQPRAAAMVGWIFTTIGLLSLFIQGGLIGPLKKRVGELNLVLVGTLMMAIGLALVPIPTHFWGQFPVAALIAIGNGISAPVLVALTSILTPEAERGEITGVFQSMQSLGRIIGPLLGNFLFGAFSHSAPYFAGGTIMLAAFLLSLSLRSVCQGVPEPAHAKT